MAETEDRFAGLTPEKKALLALWLKEKKAKEAAKPVIMQRQDPQFRPLSAAQQRLWFLTQYDPDSPFYNIPAALRLKGALNRPVLQQCLNVMVCRHEILRTVFSTDKGHPVQKLISDCQLPLVIEDLTGVHASQQAAVALEAATREARQPFDLAKGPLVRARLLVLSENEHLFLLTFHHIVADGWSITVLVNELNQLYSDILAGKSGQLPELSLQYADFAAWQRNWIQSQECEDQLGYWKQVLQGMPGHLDLYIDQIRPHFQTNNGAHYHCMIEPSLWVRVNAFARQTGVTPFMVFLAAFQVLLYRFSGQEDFGVGVPVANRNHVELEQLVGFFVNTVVMRSEFEEGLTFRKYLEVVRERTLGAFNHQDIPFDLLVDHLQPQRDISRTPLFQVMFDYQSSPVNELHLGGLQAEILNIETGSAKFDLLLTINENAGSASAVFEYNTGLFYEESIQRMAACYWILLADALGRPDQPVAALRLLDQAEEARVIHAWNRRTGEFAAETTLSERFEAWANQTPDTLAVFYEGARLTYAELNRQANQLASHLQTSGVRPDDVVALCIERSVDMVVGWMGILKAGAAYLPLDPSYPAERLNYMLKDSRAAVLVTNGEQSVRLNLAAETRILLDEDWPEISTYSEANLTPAARPENLAYVIYTSGSTGQPKAAMIEHRSALNLAAGLQAEIYSRIERQSLRVSLNAPLSFDASVQQLVALTMGHAVYIIPQETRLDGRLLVEYIRRYRLDVVDCVPTQLKLMLDCGLLTENQWVPAAVLPGGEAIDAATWQILAAAPHTEFYNMYGPTECTVDATIGRVKEYPQRPTIGNALQNNRLYVLDAHRQPVPVGVPGELFIGGVGVGRGYLNRPELTAQRFLPDPFDGKPEARMYRTGDLVRRRSDGTIDFLGRVDSQVKVRGFRIELGEIETVLKKHPAVDEAVVVVRSDQPGEQRLAAYYVLHKGVDPVSGSQLARSIKATLPDYMIPAFFMELPGFPLTPNGKIDRRALPVPDQLRPSLETTYTAPRTAQEEVLVEVWQEVLGLDKVGVEDNFFELGGDSIRAAVLANRLEETTGVRMPVKEIFALPTAAAQAAWFEQQSRSGLPAERDLSPAPRTGILPLSFSQQRLWVMDQLVPESALYNIAAVFEIEGTMDLEIFQRCVDELYRRHEILRTVYPSIHGQPHAVILPPGPLQVSVFEFRRVGASTRRLWIEHEAQLEAQMPFNLAEGPLIRLELGCFSPTDHVLIVCMHHIITDGWSADLFVRELSRLYLAFSTGRSSPLAESGIQYIDYAVWQRQWLNSADCNKQLEYWKNELKNLPPLLELPIDHPRPSAQTFRGDIYKFSLAEPLTAKLRAFAIRHQSTLFMVLLAALEVLLFRYTSQDDFAIGIPTANRRRKQLEDLIGFFVNTLAIRARLEEDISFVDLLDQVKARALGAFQHDELPFDLLVDRLQPQRDLSHSPLFQVMFAMQNTPRSNPTESGLIFRAQEINTGTAKFDLTLFVVEEGEQIAGAWEYNSDLFERSTVERMSASYLQLLEGIVRDPQQAVWALPVVSAAERELQVKSWNATGAPYPAEKSALEMIYRAGEKNPEAPAVRRGSEVIRYRELLERSAGLGRYLRQRGVGRDVLVGVCLERSLELVTALLGVWQAGGAYVPLDPGYPAERLSYMLKDAQAAVLVTDSRLAETLGVEVETVCMDRGWEEVAQAQAGGARAETELMDLAYVIYTSGSTGQPKGAMIEQRGLVNYLNWVRQAYPLEGGSGAPVQSSISFDLTVTSLLGPLVSGGCVELVEESAGAEGLGQLLAERSGYSLIKITPAHLQLLGEQTEAASAASKTRAFIIGGENLSGEQIAYWQQHAPGTELVNEYGPTETVVGCCVYWVAPGERVEGVVPIGRPIINTRLYVLDKHRQIVPIGVAGELWIGGDGVGRGYWNRPELTAERYIENPYEAGERLYRSGDLVRMRADGNLECLGRIDHQVKIRGFRVELGEVESVLGQQAGVKECVVWVQTDGGVKRLVGYVVAEAGHVLAEEHLKEGLKARLPDYMVPAAIVELGELPLTANGKVDRKALPEVEWGQQEERGYSAPEGRGEEVLSRIWGRVLGLERVGVNDNFFELGGDSILSIQVVSQARQAGMSLSARQMFEHPTIHSLAQVVMFDDKPRPGSEPVTGDYPLTPIQRWFMKLNLAQPQHWNQAVLLSFDHCMEPGPLRAALNALIKHHAVLRSRFVYENDDWHGHIPEEWVEPPLDLFILGEMEEGEALEQIHQIGSEIQSGLDPNRGLCFRAGLFHASSSACYLLLAAHHLVIDGVSWRFLLEDLLNAYDQARQNLEIYLPAPSTSFPGWAKYLALQVKPVETALQYWQHLADPRVESNRRWNHRHFKDAENLEADEDLVHVTLSAEETRQLLQEVPARYGTDINEALLTALARAHENWSGEAQLWLELESHGRVDRFEAVDLSRSVGWFTVHYPVLLESWLPSTNGGQDIGKLLVATKELLRTVSPHGFDYWLAAHQNPESYAAELGHLPEPEISFNYLGQVDLGLVHLPGVRLLSSGLGHSRGLENQRTQALIITAWIEKGALHVDWSFSRNQIDRQTVQTFGNFYISALSELIVHCINQKTIQYTPSDFKDIQLDQREIETMLDELMDE